MELYWVAGIILITVIAVPNRLRFWINQTFATIWIPIRELDNVCEKYAEDCPVRAKRMLESGGIEKPPYATKFFGTVFIFVVTVISVLADLELVILTLMSMNMEGKETEIVSFTGLSPSVLMAVVLMSGAAMMGILVLERYIPGMMPDSMAKNKTLTKAFMIISGILLIGALIAVAMLGYIRATTVSQSDAEIVKMIENSGSTSEIEQQISQDQSVIEMFIFMFISILSLVNGILGVLVFPAFLMIVAYGLLYITLLPVRLLKLISFTVDCIVSLLYRILIAGLNVIVGLTKGLNKIAQKKGPFDDTVEGEESPPRADPPVEWQTGQTNTTIDQDDDDSIDQTPANETENAEERMREVRVIDEILDPYSENVNDKEEDNE